MTRELRPYEVLCEKCGEPKNKFASRCPTCPSGVEVLYRYEDKLLDDLPRVYLRTFKVLRETRETWFIETFEGAEHYLRDRKGVERTAYERRCLKDARRSYAYPTIELARNSYEIRKKKQLDYLSRQHDHVLAIVKRIEAGTAYDPLPDDPWGDVFALEEKAS